MAPMSCSCLLGLFGCRHGTGKQYIAREREGSVRYRWDDDTIAIINNTHLAVGLLRWVNMP